VTAVELLAEFHRLGIWLGVRNGIIVARPKGATPPELREAVKAMKAELLQTLPGGRADKASVDPAEMALGLLARLRGYTLPSGRMPVARDLAERMRGLTDTATILSSLRDFEREMVALGGKYDPELTEAVEMVQGAFPGARLMAVNRKLQ
jgi:hypothetical protein